MLYVSHTGRWGGGAEVVLLQLIMASRRAGYVAHLVCPAGELADRLAPLCATVTLVRMPQFERTRRPAAIARWTVEWLAAAPRIAHAARHAGAGVIHANSGVAALTAALPARIARRPLVWHQHDIVPYRRINHAVLGAYGRLASAIVACSQATADALIRVGAPRERVELLYNCVRPAFFSNRPPGPESRRALGLPASGTLFTVVGRLVPRKGQAVFLRALARLADDGHDVYGVLLGAVPHDASGAGTSTAYEDDLHRLADQPALRGRVFFLGHRDDVQTVLAASDVMVLPSFAEPFPLAVLEAFAAGTPVVASNGGGHPEAIEDGVTGLLAVPGDDADFARVMRSLVVDPGLCDALAARARERALAEFSEDTLAGRLEALYARLGCPVLPPRTNAESVRVEVR